MPREMASAMAQPAKDSATALAKAQSATGSLMARESETARQARVTATRPVRGRL
jgi:hypothetical protein